MSPTRWRIRLSLICLLYTSDAADITYDEFDHPSFDCICRGELRGRYTLMVPGLHNVSNALAAIALADELQLPENAIHEGFATFRGTDRRFQYKGTYLSLIHI